MQYEVTANGTPYTWELAGSAGGAFTLFPLPHQTKEDVKAAKQWLRDNHDVVTLRIADEEDRDYEYKGEIYRHPICRELKWYQINAEDAKLLRKCRCEGMSADTYVQTYVVPFIEQTEKAIRLKHNCPTGDPLYN